MTSKPTVFVTRTLPDAVEARLKRDYTPRLNGDDRLPGADEVIEGCRGADALIPCPTDKITADVISRLDENVKVIASFSVGYEHIDTNAARDRGIVVTNTPDVLTDATADIAMLLMLGAARRAYEGECMVREATWGAWAPTAMRGVHLTGNRLGILGMGRIGQAVARRAAGFEMEVHYHNRSKLPADQEHGATFHAGLDSLLAVSDVLSVHCPSTPDTLKILNAESIAKLPDGAIVVNTARGNVIDDEALIAALSSGNLFAAGLDVYDGEPNIHPGYRDLTNAFLLPHLGSATVATRDAMGFRAVDNLDAFFAGREPGDRVA
ncbi:MAG: D-glycerate dehydrogenase [Rhodospirillaceae bacterium]|nr:D-glycerate dehydrogenase [Rhodospirillaceae bacterium]